ncbi:p11 protein [Blueberry virus A]|uniref:p11 protein n=1 Tax=Blueberry virus A TaxID=1206566 RepID=J7MBT6_9CLOS|nr:p11 protein [Blueberry virus A]BAM37099.1 p11 protein [Blueberry virus A]
MKKKEITEDTPLEIRQKLLRRRECNRLSSQRSRDNIRLKKEIALREIENLKVLNSSLTVELNELMTNFISINEENKMLLMQVSYLRSLLLI